ATEVMPSADPAGEPPKATGALQPADVPTPLAPSDLRRSVEEPQQGKPGAAAEGAPAAPAQPAAAPAPAGNDSIKPAPTVDPGRRARGGRPATRPERRGGRGGVSASAKKKRIFARQGMGPLFALPVTIDEPDQPLGTHVFTAMAVTGDGAGMRWNLMTIPTDS